MPARRLLILVAILMGTTALAAGLAAPPSRTPIPTPEPARPSAGGQDTALVERTVQVSEPGTVVVDEGDLVRLSVAGDVSDVVELVGLDRTAPIAPETDAVFDVLADEPGTYPLRLVAEERRVGALRVTPAAE